MKTLCMGLGLNACRKDNFVLNKRDVTITAPADLYSVVGVESEVYFDNLLTIDAGKEAVNWDVSGDAGIQTNGKWSDTPTDITDDQSALTVGAYTPTGQLLVSKTFNYNVAQAADHGSANILYMGDSTVASGNIVTNLVTHDTSDSAVSFNFIGTKGTGPAYHEGYSGKTVEWFYTHADSPFTKNGVFNYADYLTDNVLETPDVIFIQLGINDVFSLYSDGDVQTKAADNIVKLEAMISAFLAVNTGTTVVLNMVTLPSDQDDMGGNYGVGQTAWRMKRNCQLYNSALIAHSWHRNVRLLPVNLYIDTTTEMKNGVHPSADGYVSIADGVYAFLKNKLPMNIAYHDSKYNNATRMTSANYFNVSGDDLIQTYFYNEFNGIGITFKASEKTTYNVSIAATWPDVSKYAGVLLWNRGSSVDYDMPTDSRGYFKNHIGTLNYGPIPASAGVRKEISTTIDLSAAPDFDAITIHVNGYYPAGGLDEYSRVHLDGTSLKKA